MQERDLFDAALALPDAAGRRAYLAAACAGDEALARRVEALLLAHEGAGSFLERPAFLGLGAGLGPTEAMLPSGERVDARDDEDDDDPLDFLEPSAQPGSLGRLAHYEVLEVLGRGGFGTVVRAFDEKLHRAVAIKVMARGLAATSPPRKRFLREARAAAAVRHEHVVSIHAVDEQPVPYLVMEYVAGPTLQQKLDRSGPIEIPEVLRIGHEIATGLAAAHRQGLIHRDIKPANILLEDAAERVKITDFGLARAADDASLTQSGVIAGTPMYMAPEQALGEAIDRRADLFSLGSVLYVMCTGRPPFRASSTLAVLRRVAEDAPRPIPEVIPEVPADLCDLIARLHAKDPADRFATAEEVADQLKGQLDALRSPPGVRPAVAPPRPGARRKPAPLDSEFAPVDRRRARGNGDPSLLAGSSLGTLLIWSFVAVLVLAGLFAVEQARRPAAEVVATPAPPVPQATPAAPVASGTLEISIDDLDAEVVVTGDGTSSASPGGTWNHLFTLRPGKYRYTARRQGRVVGGGETFITANQPQRVQMFVANAAAVATSAVDLGRWGRFVDPEGGSRAEVAGDRLTIEQPRDAPRDLNPTNGGPVDAPRTSQSIVGDFTAEVTVSLPAKPLDSSIKPPSGGYTYYEFTGLFVGAGDDNLLRFGVARHYRWSDGRPFLDFRYFRDRRSVADEMEYAGTGTLHLRASRRGSSLSLHTSIDGRAWSEYRRWTLVGMPAAVQVGVASFSTGALPFTTRYEGWSLKPLAPPLAGREADPATPAAAEVIEPWGRFVDPKGGSRVGRDDDRGTISMPVDTPRDLNPTINDTDAPRVVTDVVGDFKFEVTVLPFPVPDAAASRDGGGNVYHWFGPVVWADGGNFFRFGVGRSTIINDGAPDDVFESFREGRAITLEGSAAPAATTHFQVERRGDTLFVRRSADGQRWSAFRTCSLAGMPARLQVGVAAVNTGNDVFAPSFVGWRLQPQERAAPDPGGGPVPATAPDLGPWGRLVTPVAACRATPDGDRLTIELPAGAPCDLNPAFDKDLAAPRVVRAIEGDFTAQVKILPSPRPELSPDAHPRDRTFHFAGMLVWADERNFLRFGVNGNTDFEAGNPCLDLEFFRNLKDIAGDVRHTDAGPWYVQAERRGNTLTLKTSATGLEWKTYRTCSLTGLPAKLYVGVTAINTGAGSFAPEFADWSLDSTGGVAPRAANDFEPWGVLVDPAGGGAASWREGGLTLSAPGDRSRDLNPGVGFDLNAPRVLRPVTGDFTVGVTVPPFPRAGREAIRATKSNAYHGAGLVVWANPRNFLRFDRGSLVNDRDGAPQLRFELYRNPGGGADKVLPTHEGPAHLQVERRGNTLIARTSDDGRTWSDCESATLPDLPAEVRVGVAALNTGTDEFAARFEDWSLRPAAPR